MKTFGEKTYGQSIAAVYDEWFGEFDAAAITLLHELAQGGRALELGIGTGRIALPLHQSGVEVHGIDASEAMVARLRAKPGGETLPITIGNFADVPVEGKYALVYVVVNTFYALLTQEEQVRCFQSVARHLTPEGVFLVEAFFPDVARFQHGQQAIRAIEVGLDQVRLDVTAWDPVAQLITSQHVRLSEDGVRLYPVKLRYAWPSEFDLMAQLAGMKLKHRWSDWKKAAFTAGSAMHISVYERAL